MTLNDEMVAANNRTLWVAQQANVSSVVVNGLESNQVLSCWLALSWPSRSSSFLRQLNHNPMSETNAATPVPIAINMFIVSCRGTSRLCSEFFLFAISFSIRFFN